MMTLIWLSSTFLPRTGTVVDRSSITISQSRRATEEVIGALCCFAFLRQLHGAIGQKRTPDRDISLSFCKLRDSRRGRELGGIVSFFKQNKNWYVATCSTIKIISGDRIYLFLEVDKWCLPKSIINFRDTQSILGGGLIFF
jgi:hypothetical protein